MERTLIPDDSHEHSGIPLKGIEGQVERAILFFWYSHMEQKKYEWIVQQVPQLYDAKCNIVTN